MRIQIYSARPHDEHFLGAQFIREGHEVRSTAAGLGPDTVDLANGSEAICTFVNDQLDAGTLSKLHQFGVRLILQRAAGVDNIDLDTARQLGLAVAHAPTYSPWAVAEHATALLLALNRHIAQAWQQVQHCNYLLDGLLGFDLHEKTVLVVGTGRIGQCFCRIMQGFGCHMLAYDPFVAADQQMENVEYGELTALWPRADVVSLHAPLLPATRHMVDAQLLLRSKPEMLLVNTGRGALVNTRSLINALAAKQFGGYAADVYENEKALFFHDCSKRPHQDPMLDELLSLPNVIMTPHQAFFTREALQGITLAMTRALAAWQSGQPDSALIC